MKTKESAGSGNYAAGPGKRASNKADKLLRIRVAARALFETRGFDDTTLRDIAAHAQVGFGTIFDYASNKRDLLFLIFNPEMVRALEDSYGAALLEKNFLDQVMALFGGQYRLHYRERQISRVVLREMNFFSAGTQAEQFLAHRAQFLNLLTGLVANAQRRKLIGAREPAALIAQGMFGIYAWEIRRWQSRDDAEINVGLRELRSLLSLQIRGLRPHAGAL